ncbi:hypothetical protein [Streptomyces boncukensis]|uniref:Stress-response A/B barrel domain-containing protein n=1 Tax=Streptomyces boncukensis TaxID=2711219 RepID=A0A6G4X0A1_9ACTN|nr:hypothetical protein [Streptomyces boncukensis]NGO70287.1 hypothetical protein [Streptomyces boncukensis]
MIVHTLIYRFPETTRAEDLDAFFAAARELVVSTGLMTGFDVKPHLMLPADERARGMTAAYIVQFACDDLEALAKFSELPAVFDFITDWKERLGFEAAYANHEQLDLTPASYCTLPGDDPRTPSRTSRSDGAPGPTSRVESQ